MQYDYYIPTLHRTKRRAKSSGRLRITVRPDWTLYDEENPTVERLMRRMNVPPKLQPDILAQVMLCRYYFPRIGAHHLCAYFDRSYGVELTVTEMSLIAERIDWLEADKWHTWNELLRIAANNFTGMQQEEQEELGGAWEAATVPEDVVQGWPEDPTKGVGEAALGVVEAAG